MSETSTTSILRRRGDELLSILAERIGLAWVPLCSSAG